MFKDGGITNNSVLFLGLCKKSGICPYRPRAENFLQPEFSPSGIFYDIKTEIFSKDRDVSYAVREIRADHNRRFKPVYTEKTMCPPRSIYKIQLLLK